MNIELWHIVLFLLVFGFLGSPYIIYHSAKFAAMGVLRGQARYYQAYGKDNYGTFSKVKKESQGKDFDRSA